MATSGTYVFAVQLADCIDEAFERCRVDPSTLDVSHVISARRSIQFMLVDWAVLDNQDYRIDLLADFPLSQGVKLYVIDPDVDGRIIDVNMVSLTRDGVDTTIYPMSRQELFDIPDKNFQGRPSRYFADKMRDRVEITLWNVPENSTDTLQIYAMRKYNDAGVASNEPDISYYMREAFASGLAWKLGEKFAPEPILPRLKAMADQKFKEANGAQRERGDVIIVPASNYRLRRGGRAR